MFCLKTNHPLSFTRMACLAGAVFANSLSRSEPQSRHGSTRAIFDNEITKHWKDNIQSAWHEKIHDRYHSKMMVTSKTCLPCQRTYFCPSKAD